MWKKRERHGGGNMRRKREEMQARMRKDEAKSDELWNNALSMVPVEDKDQDTDPVDPLQQAEKAMDLLKGTEDKKA